MKCETEEDAFTPKHNYIYDGSIEGLFSAIFDCWTDKNTSEISRKSAVGGAAAGADINNVAVVTCVSKYDRIKRWIENTLGKSGMIKINRVFLTEESGSEIAILKYLKLAAVLGRDTDSRATHSAVAEINALERSYCSETHRMYGFINFTELENGIMYAGIGTRYNQLETLIDFYHGRMPGKKIIIYDTRRKTAAVCSGEGWKITEDFPDESFGEDCNSREHDAVWLKRLSDICSV